MAVHVRLSIGSSAAVSPPPAPPPPVPCVLFPLSPCARVRLGRRRDMRPKRLAAEWLPSWPVDAGAAVAATACPCCRAAASREVAVSDRRASASGGQEAKLSCGSVSRSAAID